MPYKNDPQNITDVQAALAAGAALGEPCVPPVTDGATPYAVIPEDYKIESLEEFLPRPLRIEQAVALHDTDSFIEYVGDYSQIGTTRIFFSAEKEQFVAVIDYHKPADEPGWCDHTATFQARRSVEFATWMNQNRKAMTQVDFARFLEENIPDIVEPPGAEMLALALTFEAKKSVEFASGVRLASGQIQLTYDEVVRGAAQNGVMEIPESFVLGLPIHMNGPAYRIPVRLRWRLAESKLSFWYELVRPHRYIEDALKEIRQRIATDTGIDVLAGTVGE